jgi:basic membrane protein A
VISAYVVNDFSSTAFHDPVAGNNFAQQLMQQNPGTDVMFQVAGDTGNGVLQAACAAGINGIGVDVDPWLSLNADNNPTYQCLVTSATKAVQKAVSDAITGIAAGTVQGGDFLFNAASDGVGIAPEHDGKGLITPEIQAKLDAAFAGMKDGSVVSCPTNCGSLAAPPASPAPSGS